MTITTKLLLLILSLSLAACSEQPAVPKIGRQPAPADFSFMNTQRIPVVQHYVPNSGNTWQNDFRSTDISGLDLREYGPDLLWGSFDSRTIWPEQQKMPEDFSWQQIMKTGKNPGLGFKNLHKCGITGKGIGIAIVYQPLLIEHEEYKNRLRLYEELNVSEDENAAMHGAAVASIAVGKTVGVAPGADLYYIAAWPGTWDRENGFIYDFSYYAQAIRRILEINRDLPAKNKIKAIALQIGWNAHANGAQDINAAIQEASAAGVFVISSSLDDTHGLHFHGLARDPLGNPDNFAAYRPGSWWSSEFYASAFSTRPATLLVPMDARTTASPTGNNEYVYYGEGGWSWVTPYLAASYALALQLRPDLKPEDFWNAALKSGRTIDFEHEGSSRQLGIILDPEALVAALRR